MIEKLIAYFSKFQPLSQKEKNILRKGINIQVIKKGVILLKEGAVPRDNFFIIKGSVRQYYLLDGIEKTSYFFTENDWILPFTNIENNGLSTYYLECIEETHLVIANDRQGNDFLEEFPKFQKIARLILEKEVVRQQNELSKYINQTPEQRYIALQENRPNLISRVPQYQISSYIGIKPESLSRIRKRIANKLSSKK